MNPPPGSSVTISRTLLLKQTTIFHRSADAGTAKPPNPPPDTDWEAPSPPKYAGAPAPPTDFGAPAPLTNGAPPPVAGPSSTSSSSTESVVVLYDAAAAASADTSGAEALKALDKMKESTLSLNSEKGDILQTIERHSPAIKELSDASMKEIDEFTKNKEEMRNEYDEEKAKLWEKGANEKGEIGELLRIIDELAAAKRQDDVGMTDITAKLDKSLPLITKQSSALKQGSKKLDELQEELEFKRDQDKVEQRKIDMMSRTILEAKRQNERQQDKLREYREDIHKFQKTCGKVLIQVEEFKHEWSVEAEIEKRSKRAKS
ncbi:unnamed protein product [Orchesella dallaii]|uniref:Uncharacterized protein n=1 Tax=Orchesella dallaii TaxID=48710 RepID=A0ABP1PLE2_9HEXA